jgi:hypothetical protein
LIRGGRLVRMAASMNEGDPPQSPQEDKVKPAQDNTNYIKFLGTAGARVVVAKQLRSSAGTFIQLNATKFFSTLGQAP